MQEYGLASGTKACVNILEINWRFLNGVIQASLALAEAIVYAEMPELLIPHFTSNASSKPLILLPVKVLESASASCLQAGNVVNFDFQMLNACKIILETMNNVRQANIHMFTKVCCKDGSITASTSGRPMRAHTRQKSFNGKQYYQQSTALKVQLATEQRLSRFCYQL